MCHDALRRAVALLVLAAALVWLARGEAAPLVPLRVADGVYVLRGSGGEVEPANGGRVANVAFVVGPHGVVVIDTGVSYREGADVIAAVATITPRPIRLAILSHPSQEAIFGAGAFQDRGIPVLAHRKAAELIASRCATCLARLGETLGPDAMAGTRVIVPDRLIDGDATVDAIGRPLDIIAPAASSAPGALAVLDRRTSTLLGGTLASVRRIPDLRDADVDAWRAALPQLATTRCRHLVGAYGAPGTCADVAGVARYLDALDRRVQSLLRAGVGLIDVPERARLPDFETWDGYGTLHAANASRTYLRLERLLFR